MTSTMAAASSSKGNSIPKRQPPPNMKIPLQDPTSLQAGMKNLQVFSPVNQDGCFDFDRVIKAGQLLKRTRRTKNWKPIHIVLRPNVLSLYKDADATKLRHQIKLQDITAIARQKDPKGRTQYVFALFTPSRNYHLAASTEKEVDDWAKLIRTEARIDEEEEELMSPTASRTAPFQSLGGASNSRREMSSSISETDQPGHRPQSSTSYALDQGRRKVSYTTADYSGNEQGSYSDFSDTAGPGGVVESNLSLSHPKTPSANVDAQAVYGLNKISTSSRNDSQQKVTRADSERVICHGWLYVLKSKRGVRQWKKLWVVLRPKALAFYKNEEEYRANLIIPFHSISDAVDIDPVSKTKIHCMQIISEERNYRCSAPDEDSLARWLGAFKSLLAKRREGRKERAAQGKENEPAHAQASVSSRT